MLSALFGARVAGKFTSPLVKGIAILAIAGIALGGTYIKGRFDGRHALLQQLAADRIKIYQDGRKIDDEVFGADDPALCALLGGCGVPDDAESN